MAPYKDMYENLQRDYKLLMKKNEIYGNQIEDLKLELQHVINENVTAISSAKAQIKRLKAERDEKITNLVENLTNKEK